MSAERGRRSAEQKHRLHRRKFRVPNSEFRARRKGDTKNMIDEMTTVLAPSPLPDFVETKSVKDITKRTLSYIKAGFPVHFRGVSGTGKTTLAMHIASKIQRPV